MKMGDVLIVSIVLLTSMVAITTIRARHRVPAPVEAPAIATIITAGATIGNDTAPYVLGVFTDYQCLACLRLEEELTSLRAALGDSLRTLYLHLPALGTHPNALTAAVAAECARMQGWFPEVHRELVRDTAGVRLGRWLAIAEAASVPDLPAFASCIATRHPERVISQTLEWARAAGLRGTPTLVIGNDVILGGMPADVLLARLRNHAAQRRSAVRP